MGIMDESRKSQYKYCHKVKIFKKIKGIRDNVGFITIHCMQLQNNHKKSCSLSYDNKANEYRLHCSMMEKHAYCV